MLTFEKVFKPWKLLTRKLPERFRSRYPGAAHLIVGDDPRAGHDGKLLMALSPYSAVAVPCSLQAEEDGTSAEDPELVPVSAAKLAAKGNDAFRAEIHSRSSGLLVKGTDGSQTFERPSGDFPDISAVLNLPDEGDGTAEVCFNARLLWEIAEAMGSERVRLIFGEHRGAPMEVRPMAGGSEAFGVLMRVTD